MPRRSVRNLFLLGVVVGIVVSVLRASRRDTRPAPSAPASPVAPPPRPRPDPAPVEVAVPTSATPPAAPVTPPTPTAQPEERSWAEPVDGACPDGYPIKAKASSGIFHRPGGLSYERTVPDRCYPDAATAEADGYRAAKR